MTQSIRSLNVALVGCGGFASTYRRVYTNIPGVRWKLAVDASMDVLAACRAEGAAEVSADFENALAEDIDVVVISTPNHLHAAHATAALRFGKHVLLQKPLANSMADAAAILQAAEGAKTSSGMYMSSYDEPAVWEVRRIIQQGLLGTIQTVRCHDSHTGGLRSTSDSWRADKRLTGGGSCVQLTIHGINLLQWWLEQPIVRVAAFSNNLFCPNIGGDDMTVAALTFGNGVQGTAESGWASAGGYTRELFGSSGWLRLSLDRHVLDLCLDEPYRSDLINYTDCGQMRSYTFPEVRFDDATNPYNQHIQFIKSIRAGEPASVPVKQGFQDFAVINAIYQAAKEARVIDVCPVRPSTIPAN